MHSSCPNCDARLKDFEFSCDRCGWSLDRPDDLPISEPEKSIAEQPTEVDLFLDKARDSIEEGNFAQAVKFLNRAIVDASKEQLAECFSLRGYAYLKQGNFEHAENDCTEAIDRHWHEAQTFAWRAAARGEQNKWRLAFDDLADACRVAGNQRDPFLHLIQSYTGVASEYFRKRIKDGTDNADMFFDRGWVYFQSANYAKAERDFELALELLPTHAWSALGMAKSKLKSRKLNKKLLIEIGGLCEIALGGASDCRREALKTRAQANYEYGHLAKASKDLRRLREITGKDAKLLIECGELRQQLGDHVAAISDFTNAFELDPDQTYALQCRGDCYAAIRNYRLAIDDYTRFLRAFPDDLSARVKRGQVYSKSGRRDLALSDFDRVLEDDPTCCDAYLGRSKIFLDREQLDQALTECEKAVRLDNQRAEAFETLAEIYFKLCDYGRAIEEFGRAIRLANNILDKAQYVYRRGTAQYELDEFEAALADFKESIELRPNHAGTRIWMAAAASRLEKWPTAIVGLQDAISIRPTAAEQYYTLGKPVAERAIEFFRNQIQRGKKSASIYRNRGLAYQFIGDHEQAIGDFTGALNLDAKDCEALVLRGQTYAKMNRHEEAIDDFKHAIRLDDTNHWARFCRALSRAAIGEHSRALQDVVKAIMASPRQPRYHILHAELLQKSDRVRRSGDWSRVIKAFDRAIRIDSADPQTHRRRALAHLHSGSLLEAIHDFTRCLELDPRKAEVIAQRGQAYLKNNQLDMALEDFELALTRNPKLAKAYAGRVNVLMGQNRHEYALIWLTKAIHRFENPRDLAEIIFSRGKVFYQMKRFERAVADFTIVCELMKNERGTRLAATQARAISWVLLENFDNAKRDFEAILKMDQNHGPAKVALAWLQNTEQPQPAFFTAPSELIRPTKPSVVTDPIEIESETEWQTELPYNTWVLRNGSKKEYGPVTKPTLDVWVSEGRVDVGMKILRADWPKWKKVEVVYPELARRMSAFPEIQTRAGMKNGSIAELPAVEDSAPAPDMD